MNFNFNQNSDIHNILCKFGAPNLRFQSQRMFGQGLFLNFTLIYSFSAVRPISDTFDYFKFL